MRVKIAKIEVTVHEVDLKAKCPHCSNMITSYDGDQMHADVVTVSRDMVYLDPVKAREKGEPYHFMGMGSDGDEVYVTTLTCGKCGETIVGKDTVVDDMSGEQRRKLIQSLMEPWSAAS